MKKFFTSRPFVFVVLLLGFFLYKEFNSMTPPIPYPRNDYAIEEMAMDTSYVQPRMALSNSKVSNRVLGGVFMGKASAATPQNSRKIIKNGTISLEAENTEKLSEAVKSVLKKEGGEVLNMNSWQVRPNVLGYSMSAKVPSDKLEIILEKFTGVAKKTAESFTVNDITEQYQDTENRIKNLEVRRDRIRELLKTKTKELKDVLEVDRELNNVQNELERLQRTQKKNDDKVAFSRLQISINPEPVLGDAGNPYWSLENSWKMSINNLIEVAKNVFDKALEYIILAPIWIPILLFLYWGLGVVIRKFQNKKK